MSVTEKLARFVVDTAYADIPREGRRKAAQCILDCVGVTLAGSVEPIHVPVMQYLEEVGGHPHATIIGRGGRTSVSNAAFANGVFGHVLDFDDTNQIFVGHGSVVVVPAILALAQRFELTGKDIVTAYLVGTEVQWRLGDAFVSSGNHYAKGWHSTCTIGSFGAAAAAGKLLRLDADRMAHAFGIAASEAAGFQEQFGTHAKSFHAGRANENGVKAALLARGGFTSSRTALEGNVGYARLVADEYDLEKVSDFGKPWGILEPTFGRGINLKKYPVCASGLGAIEGMLSLVEQHDIEPDEVAAVECRVRPKSLDILMHHDPRTGLEAKFSAEYWIAASVLDRTFGLIQTTDERVRRPEVRALVRKVTVTPDPSIDLATARVKIHVELKDGRSYDTVYYPHRGAADNPMSDDELIAKFTECAAWGGLPAEKIERAATTLLEIERLEDIDALLSLLTVR